VLHQNSFSTTKIELSVGAIILQVCQDLHHPSVEYTISLGSWEASYIDRRQGWQGEKNCIVIVVGAAAEKQNTP
jgi:hypothetical protein